MTKILGLDQSSTSTGWALSEGGQLIETGVISKKQSKEEYEEKVYDICLKVKELVKEYEPDLVVFEDIQNQGNMDIFKKLAQLQGCLIFMLRELGVKYEILHTATWRKELGMGGEHGKGVKRDEWKKRAQHYAEDLGEFNVCNDIDDAICITMASQKKWANEEIPLFNFDTFDYRDSAW